MHLLCIFIYLFALATELCFSCPPSQMKSDPQCGLFYNMYQKPRCVNRMCKVYPDENYHSHFCRFYDPTSRMGSEANEAEHDEVTDDIKTGNSVKNVIDPDPDQICKEDPDKGSCRQYTARFYFCQKTNTCRRFVYGGCGGNSNNFISRADCEATCLTQAEKTFRWIKAEKSIDH